MPSASAPETLVIRNVPPNIASKLPSKCVHTADSAFSLMSVILVLLKLSPPLIVMNSVFVVPGEIVPSYYQIVQTDVHVLIFSEWIHDARVIRLRGTHLPPTIRKWLGDSIGHYDGDTLVVDTTNFRHDTRTLDSGERLHVVERFTRVDPKTLRYRVTVEDPDTWATAWTAEWPFRATDVRMFPVECHEGNYAIENFMRGARFEERRARERPR